MTDTIQVGKSEQPKVWRLFSNVLAAHLEDLLNEMSEQGYQVYKLDRVEDVMVSMGVVPLRNSYDVVMFNPVLLGTKQMEGMQAAFKKAGIDTAGLTPGPTPVT